MPWHVAHIIDKDSPLHPYVKDGKIDPRSDWSLVVCIDGTDALSQSAVHSSCVYEAPHDFDSGVFASTRMENGLITG